MNPRVLAFGVAIAAATMWGQARYTPPKTPWGDPDIQGNWPAAANIPLQRPAALGERTTLTDEEFAEKQAQAAKAVAEREEFSKKTVGIGPPAGWGERGSRQLEREGKDTRVIRGEAGGPLPRTLQ